MARTIFFTVLALLFVMAYAAPKQAEHKDVSPDDIINALDMGIITGFHTIITLKSFVTSLAGIEFDVKNSLPIELTIKNISVAAGLDGTEYLAFNQMFEEPGLVLPGLSINNTGTIDNVLFVHLNIVPAGVLDVLAMNVSVCAPSQSEGDSGISLEVDDLKQDAVPAIYDLSLGG